MLTEPFMPSEQNKSAPLQEDVPKPRMALPSEEEEEEYDDRYDNVPCTD